MLRRRYFVRLFAAYAAVILVTAIGIGWLAGRQVRDDGERQIEERLTSSAAMLEVIARDLLAAQAPDPANQARLRALGRAIGVRLTVVDATGRVVADSERDPAAMDNHLDRPEIQSARATGHGSSRRFSRTTLEDRMYEARSVTEPDGQIGGYVRTSLTLEAVERRLDELRAAVLTGAAVATLAGLLLALVVARRVTRPIRAMTSSAEAIAAGRYDRRVAGQRGDEIGRLAGAFNRMADQLQDRIESLDFERSRLEAILGSMEEGVVALDDEERVLHLNASAARLLEVERDEAVGSHIWELIRSPTITAALREVFAAGVGAAATRAAVPAGDGLLELHAAPIEDGGAVLVFDDLTEMRRLETVRQDFVANVSHELKTPVTAIVGLVETLLDEEPPEADQRRRFLTRISEQAKRLSDLVRDLLTLSSLEAPAGGGRNPRDLDLKQIVQASLEAQQPHADARGIELIADLPEHRVEMRGEPETLRQAVDNLLANAVRYTDRGGRVTVRLDARGDEAEIEVRDTGIGIERRHLDRIFERFYRADSARSRELGGTGLGLAIVKHVALAHRGEIDVESTPGEGSTFRFTLPLTPSV